MNQIWGAEGRILLERDYWIAVVKAQKSLGIDIPDEAIEAYESVKDQVNLQSIQDREAVTRHDVKARIEEFCALAGHEHIHKGLIWHGYLRMLSSYKFSRFRINPN